jgi:hypothetical protein
MRMSGMAYKYKFFGGGDNAEGSGGMEGCLMLMKGAGAGQRQWQRIKYKCKLLDNISTMVPQLEEEGKVDTVFPKTMTMTRGMYLCL